MVIDYGISAPLAAYRARSSMIEYVAGACDVREKIMSSVTPH